MKSTDISGLKTALDAGTPPVLIDVRSGFEFASGHVPVAINVPLGSLESRVSGLKDRGPIYVICKSGNRSQAATKLLSDKGLEAVNVAGGTSAWMAAGHPVATEKSPTRLLLPLVACLTIGLAPFNPPHLIGKLQWVAGGAVGMAPTDWLDLLLHGSPWLWLAVAVVRYVTTPD